jgi:hypothetical protein
MCMNPQEPRRYYLSFQVLAAGTSAAARLPCSTADTDEADELDVEALRPDEVSHCISLA